jgi:bacteriochlorophyllide a dehydrogenase
LTDTPDTVSLFPDTPLETENPVTRNALAVVMEKPEHLVLRPCALPEATADDVLVKIEWSGISTGTERLLWSGRMPSFPGMGYPLVPGYESIGRVVKASPHCHHKIGDRVFVPGSRGFRDVRGLFGGAASHVVASSAKVISLDDDEEGEGRNGILLALAATAYHALAAPGCALPDLIVGHGVLGRLLARIAVAKGATPVVWETNPQRCGGAEGYEVMAPDADTRRDYRSIYDVSGDSDLTDRLIAHLAPGGELVLAGFYDAPIHFNFAPAFMREARLRVAAEWKQMDLLAVQQMLRSGALSLAGLITHTEPATNALAAYQTAFSDAGCLKMILDWRAHT